MQTVGPMDIRQEVAALIGHAVTDIAPLGGGCVSAVYELSLIHI